jgi:hypothetical protein
MFLTVCGCHGLPATLGPQSSNFFLPAPSPALGKRMLFDSENNREWLLFIYNQKEKAPKFLLSEG